MESYLPGFVFLEPKWLGYFPGIKKNNPHLAVLDPEKTKFERRIFPTKLWNPQKFQPFSHWLSKSPDPPK